jgi:hypothetical protein
MSHCNRIDHPFDSGFIGFEDSGDLILSPG